MDEITSQSQCNNLSLLTYRQAVDLRQETIWQNLAHITVRQALDAWFSTMSGHTATAYDAGMRMLAELKIINVDMTLQAFSLLNLNAIIDIIKQIPNRTETTRQARAACFISFTRFLARRTNNMIQKAVPCTEGNSKTFYLVHEKVTTNAMTRQQWLVFLDELATISKRDCLMAKLMLQGGKRISEVISLQTQQINFENNQIAYRQAKAHGSVRETVITHPQAVMDELKAYIGDRVGLVFVTKFGKKIVCSTLTQTFKRAGQQAKIPFRVSPHVLRTTTVTHLKKEGFCDTDIMKVTGHTARMIYAYDKNDRADNASKKISFV